MEKDSPFNIFGSQPSKKKTAAAAPAKAEAAPAAPTKSGKVVSLDPEIQSMITTMRQYHDEIERKLDDAYQKTGLDARSVRNYLDNPNNFSKEEWERVQIQRKEKLENIAKQIGGQAPSSITRSATQMAKSDKGKKNPGARRNWMPMR